MTRYNFKISGEFITYRIRETWISDLPKKAWDICESVGMNIDDMLGIVLGTKKLEGINDFDYVDDDYDYKKDFGTIDYSIDGVCSRIEKKYKNVYETLHNIKNHIDGELYDDTDQKKYIDTKINELKIELEFVYSNLLKNKKLSDFLHSLILSDSYSKPNKESINKLVDSQYCDRAVELFCKENNYSYYGINNMGTLKFFVKKNYNEILKITKELEILDRDEKQKQKILKKYNSSVIELNNNIDKFHKSIENVTTLDVEMGSIYKNIEQEIKKVSLLYKELKNRNIKSYEKMKSLIPYFIDPETNEHIEHGYILPDGKFFPTHFQGHIDLEHDLEDCGLYNIPKNSIVDFYNRGWIKITSREIQIGKLYKENFEKQKDTLTRFLLTRNWKRFNFMADYNIKDPMIIIQKIEKYKLI